MQEASFWELLFSKDSIAGAWAVIGAFIALLGVFANNLWENSRRKKEREHTLIRETYLDAVAYINHYTHKILSIGQSGQVETGSDDVAASEKFYKLFLIASPEVIDAFTQLSLKYTEIIIKLGEISLDLQNCIGKIKAHQLAIDNALSSMKQINLNLKEYNEKNKNIPKLLDLFDDHYNKAQQEFDTHTQQIEDDQKEEFELKISLLKKCMESLLETNSGTYDTIFLMRNDLDRKLSKKDSQEIKDSIDFLQENLKSSLTSYIEKLRLRILEMEQDE